MRKTKMGEIPKEQKLQLEAHDKKENVRYQQKNFLKFIKTIVRSAF